MDPKVKKNISESSTWGRLVFMLLFGIIYSVAELVLLTVVFIQFIFVLFSGDKNTRLLNFGQELSTFIYQVFLFLTFNKEEKPFPFDQWPSSKSVEDLSEPQATASDDNLAPHGQ